MHPRIDGYRAMYAALLAAVCLVSVLDVMISDEVVRLAPLTSLAPIVASIVLRLRETAVVCAVYLVVTSLVYTVLQPQFSTPNRIAVLASTGVVCVLSLVVCRLRLQREERIERLRLTAGAAQRLLLRSLPLVVGDVVVHGFYVAAAREALVGGDVYEVLHTPYGTRLLIGDVRGKGLSAIGASAAVLTSYREGAYREPDLQVVVDRMEEGLLRWEEQAASEPEEQFVTALVVETLGQEALRVIDCGHVPPFVIAGGECVEVPMKEPGLPLGLAGLASTPRGWQDIKVPIGGRVLLCTDGITEARNPEGEFYPLAERLGEWAELPTSTLLERLSEDVNRHVGGPLSDDAALLVVQR